MQRKRLKKMQTRIQTIQNLEKILMKVLTSKMQLFKRKLMKKSLKKRKTMKMSIR
jgi:hypothetical protein